MTAAVALRAAAVVLSGDKLRKVVGWVAVAVLSPLILILATICGILSGAAEHNNLVVELCFGGGAISGKVPQEFRSHMEEMRRHFDGLDDAIVDAEGMMEDGNSLDELQIKAVFYALSFGGQETAPTANSFIDCFVTYEEHTRTVTVTDADGNETQTEESYTVAVPQSIKQAYEGLSMLMGRTITEEEKKNADEISRRVRQGEGQK